jgi:hypothetical protein
MKKLTKSFQKPISKALQAGLKMAVFIAVAASHFGERVLRGGPGFEQYQNKTAELC